VRQYERTLGGNLDLQTYIVEVLVRNLNLTLTTVNEYFCGFSQSLQTKAAIVPSTRPLSLLL